MNSSKIILVNPSCNGLRIANYIKNTKKIDYSVVFTQDYLELGIRSLGAYYLAENKSYFVGTDSKYERKNSLSTLINANGKFRGRLVKRNFINNKTQITSKKISKKLLVVDLLGISGNGFEPASLEENIPNVTTEKSLMDVVNKNRGSYVITSTAINFPRHQNYSLDEMELTNDSEIDFTDFIGSSNTISYDNSGRHEAVVGKLNKSYLIHSGGKRSFEAFFKTNKALNGLSGKPTKSYKFFRLDYENILPCKSYKNLCFFNDYSLFNLSYKLSDSFISSQGNAIVKKYLLKEKSKNKKK